MYAFYSSPHIWNSHLKLKHFSPSAHVHWPGHWSCTCWSCSNTSICFLHPVSPHPTSGTLWMECSVHGKRDPHNVWAGVHPLHRDSERYGSITPFKTSALSWMCWSYKGFRNCQKLSNTQTIVHSKYSFYYQSKDILRSENCFWYRLFEG